MSASHAAQPALCADCLLEAHADAAYRGEIVLRWCERNRTWAIGRKRGGTSISSWELHLVADDREHKLFAPLLLELCASGQVATRRTRE